MIRDKFTLTPTRWKVRRVSKKVIPNQSMTMREVIERFVKGLPLDIKEKQKIYLDQVDHDFEKMSGMDLTEKAYQATEFKTAAENLNEDYKAEQKAKHERKVKADQDEAVKKAMQAKTPKTEDPKGSEKA